MKNHHKKRFKKRFCSDGIIKRHPDGFGFFIPDNPSHPDAYMFHKDIKGLMSNDRIHVVVSPNHRSHRNTQFRAKVLNLLQRSTTQVSGSIFQLSENQGLIKDKDSAWGEDLRVSWNGKLEFKDGDWVVARVTSYPRDPQGFRGVLVDVVGDVKDPLNDNLRVLARHQIPFKFSKKALKEAKHLKGIKDNKRVDLRDKGFVTIDGKTAKDFDDAIYVEREESGFHLWVAIADVSHYVKKGSVIDSEAYARGTSTYFPNFCNSMLPEALSHDLCSLKPHVDRLVVVAEMEFDFQGKMQRSKFYEAVIRSQARMMYEEVQQILESNKVTKMIHPAADLAKILLKKRLKGGSLNLEIPETHVHVDAMGTVQDIMKSERLFAHRLIEELMLAANVAVAKFLRRKISSSLYRTHAPPETTSIKTLENYLEKFGFHQKLKGGQLQKKISLALKKFDGTHRQSILNILVLRAMNQAQYTKKNIGHFGLSFSHYTHFTSPIRRYPDLIVHRLLKTVINPKNCEQSLSSSELIKAGTWLSACEQRSVSAERQLLSIKKARFMKAHVGSNFEGFISSVARFGFFVTLRTFDVDGLVRIENLPEDDYQFDEENLCFVGYITGRSYQIGDLVHVRVAAVNDETGKINFVLAQGVKGFAKKFQKKRRRSQKRGKTSKNRKGFRKVRVSKPRSKN